MNLILLERVEKLGMIGDVVTVKPGYARNFLLPQGKALRATEANKAEFEARRAQIEADNLQAKSEAEKVADKMEGIAMTVVRQASEAGMLYGSVSTRDVAEGAEAAGFTVARNQVILDRPIKTLGLHDVEVKLHPEVKVTVRVNVAKSEDEALAQLEAADNAGEEEEDSILAQAEALFDEQPAEEANED